MSRINAQGYVEKRQASAIGKWRNWWLGKANGVELGTLSVPKKYQGKRFRLKVEVIEDNEK